MLRPFCFSVRSLSGETHKEAQPPERDSQGAIAHAQFRSECSGAGIRPPRAMKSSLWQGFTGITGA